MHGVAILSMAVLVALTAPSSLRPPFRIGLSLVVGGLVVAVFAVRERRWLLAGVGAALIGGGVLLAFDGPRFIQPVTRAGGALVLLAGSQAALAASRRIGRASGAVTMLTFVAAAGLFVFYDRELLSLTLGIMGVVLVTVCVLGLVQAAEHDELTSGLGLTETATLGVDRIRGRAVSPDSGEPIRHKVLYEGADRSARYFRFLMLMGFASAIASLGVIADSTAVVIGAMLVAPLLTPLMGMSLSLVMGWGAELRRATLVAGSGMLVAVVTGFVLAAVFGQGTDVDANTQIASRISPTLLDLGIALAAGGAGAFALSRSDVSDALPGVAVAIALVPPLAVLGITAQLGTADAAFGALILFGTNALAILGMGAVTFVLTGTAASEAERNWHLGWWTVGLGAAAVVVLGALVANTSETNREGAREELAAEVVDGWIDDRDLVVQSVAIDDDVVSITLAGASTPEDIEDLQSAIGARLDEVSTVELRVALTEVTTLDLGG